MKFHVPIPFLELLGFQLVRYGTFGEADAGEAEIHFPVRHEHTNSMGMAHGGASMALLDATLAHAARSAAPQSEDLAVVTVEMKTSFMRPAVVQDGGVLVAKARILSRTLTLAFVEGGIYDTRQRLCVHATGTFKYVKHQPNKA